MRTQTTSEPWLQHVPAGIAVLDHEGTIIDVNPTWNAFAERNGAAIPRHGLGLNYVQVCIASGHHEIARSLREVLGATRSEMTLDYVCDSPVARRWYRMHAAPRQPEGALVFHWDITPQIDFEARLEDLARHEAVGRVAMGAAHGIEEVVQKIAHEVRCLLADATLTHREALERIEALTLEGRGLAQRFLTLSAQSEVAPQTFEVGAFLEERLPTLQQVAGKTVRVTKKAADRPYFIHMDPIQLEQVLLHLVTNARDAMPHGGEVCLRVEAEGAKASPMAVAIHVEDQGSGISPENLMRIFEPFFTTKTDGRATGLGLSSVHRILCAASGSISAESSQGKGSTFSVRLPLLQGGPTKGPSTARKA